MTTTKTMTLALALIMMLTMVSFISRRLPPLLTHNSFFVGCLLPDASFSE